MQASFILFCSECSLHWPNVVVKDVCIQNWETLEKVYVESGHATFKNHPHIKPRRKTIRKNRKKTGSFTSQLEISKSRTRQVYMRSVNDNDSALAISQDNNVANCVSSFVSVVLKQDVHEA